MSKKAILWILLVLSFSGSVAAFVFDADMFRFPLLLLSAVFIAFRFFQPGRSAGIEGRAAFYALTGYGVFSVLLSMVLYIVIPMYGREWGVEYNPDDAGGIAYPIVNDGHENCIFTTVIFIAFFLIAGFSRTRMKTAVNRGR